MRSLLTPILLVAVLFACLPPALAENPPPPTDFDPYLSDPAAIERLKAGETITVEKVSEEEGRTLGGGFVLAMIERPPDQVWKILSNYGDYPEFMPSVETLEYNDDEGPEYGLHYTLKILFQTIEYNVVSTQDAQARSMVWHLDESRRNDIRASRGGWWVRPLDEGRSLLLYLVNVDTGSSLPQSVINYLTRKTMPNAVRAVKKRVESGGTYRK